MVRVSHHTAVRGCQPPEAHTPRREYSYIGVMPTLLLQVARQRGCSPVWASYTGDGGSEGSTGKLRGLQEELVGVAIKARDVARQGVNWAELGTMLKQKAKQCYEAGNEVSGTSRR